MIGGDEDDQDALLQECGAVVERPQMNMGGSNEVARSTQGGSRQGDQRSLVRVAEVSQGMRDTMTHPVASGSGISNDGGLADSINRLLHQNNELLKMVAEKSQPSGDLESGGQRAKRKTRDENYEPEDPVLILEESYRIEDDGHTILDTLLRQRIRPINADPKEYWMKDSFKRVDRPILGGSLYLEHIMNGDVNPGTLCKSFDSGAFVELKNYLTKNS